MFFEACDIYNLEIFRMEILNASTIPSKSNQLRNVNTVRWESWNVTTQPWEINDRKSEVIAFVVNAGMNVTTNNFYILTGKRNVTKYRCNSFHSKNEKFKLSCIN